MSFYERDISKLTQWPGNKICISNIFRTVICHIWGEKKKERKRKIPEQSRPLPKEKHSCPTLRKPVARECLSDSMSGPDVHSIKLHNTQVLELSFPPIPINHVLQKQIRKWPLPIIHTSFLRKGTSFP